MYRRGRMGRFDGASAWGMAAAGMAAGGTQQRRIALVSCGIAAVVALCGEAHGQTTTASQAQTTILDPIVVNAPKKQTVRPATPQSGPSAPAPVSNLDALTTSSEKTAASIYDSSATVTVKSTAEMERQNINSPREFVRDEPGISMGNQPTRTGGTNFVIRGIGENRVRLEIDGVKVPDFPGTNVGPGTYTRDFVDFDALKRIEIIRGPASALYGSDAIGGVVSFVTKDPADYLDLVGKDWYTSAKVGFDSVDSSFYTTLTGATRVGAVESMLLVTRRIGHETDINSATRSPNPQDYSTTNILGKIVYNTFGAGQIKLTGEYLSKSVTTQLDSENGAFASQFAKIFDGVGDDTTHRTRLSLDWNAPVKVWFADAIKTKIYGTEVKREEFTNQLRASWFGGPEPTAPTQRRVTDLDFDQTVLGGEVQASLERKFWGGNHLITYGTSVDFTSTTRPRDRTQITLATGVSTKTVGGETYPNKNFPDTDTTQAALYIQDIAQYGALRVIPAVRFDFFSLKVNPDALFANSNTGGFAIHDQQETAISPKLGVTYDLNDNYRLFGQYARGFRAPPYDNANFGFRNPVFGYEILPNGNLSPETSDGFEGGLRGRFRNGSSFQVSAYYNTYKDFIDTVVVGMSGGLTQFQYQNLSNVQIHGVEAKGEWKFVPEWALFGSLAIAKGENKDTGAPLDSVDPLTAIAGIRYRSLHNGWGGEFRTRYVAEKDAVSSPTVFHVPAHTTFDLLASYEVAPTFTINAGVFNIFDKSYFNPQEVAGISATTSNLELYRAPGRSFAVNTTVRW
ncbi:MAG: TonB-dependent hemoglobin/transferrin/lactoferrin family receptor [Hyphomicrobiaceae bacterium]|nr:MAG: TonB-dependent hemoglobin/transferrin/lactoferrin family receptor [Hyphomicrobiaceae bacterium]